MGHNLGEYDIYFKGGYVIYKYDKDNVARFGGACAYKRTKYGNSIKANAAGCRMYELRKITFEGGNTIIVERRKPHNKNYRKFRWENITNDEFYEYFRNNIEEIFGESYIVTPNKDRTVFKMKKNEADKSYYFKDGGVYYLQENGEYKRMGYSKE